MVDVTEHGHHYTLTLIVIIHFLHFYTSHV